MPARPSLNAESATSAEAFDGFAALLGTGVLQTSLDGRILRVNDACARLFGYADPTEVRATVTNTGAQVYVDPVCRVRLISTLLVHGRIDGAVAQLRRRNGETFWASQTLRLIQDPQTGERSILTSITDITPVIEQQHALAAAERATAELRRAQEESARQMQEVLAHSAERLRNFADIASDWYWECDANNRVTFVSQGISRVGLEPSMFVGNTNKGFPAAIDQSSPGHRRIMAAMARRERYKDLVYPLTHQDGRRFMISSSGEPQFDAAGDYIGYRGISRDVTEQVAVLDALALSEARFRDAIECMAEGFTVWDAQDRLVVENRRVSEILPYLDGPAPPGVSFVDAFNDAYRVARPDITEAELDELRRVRLATRARCETGELQIPGDRVVEFTDRRTSEGGYITTYRDVTAEREAMRRIAESEARFRDFAETTADWFWEQDAELRFTYVSPSNEAISGISAAEHIGLRRTDTRKLGVSEAQWRAHLDALSRREPFKDFRYQRVDPQGRVRHLSISGKPVFGADGRFLGYRGVGKDETELVEAQHALEAALAAARAATEQEQRFATAIAHEFRTPLTIIDGAAQRLSRQVDDPRPEDMRTRIAKIRAAVRSMETLIDTMLDSARLASGRLGMERTRQDLVASVEAQIRRFDPAVTGREIVLRTDAASAAVSADARMLEHIVSNLLSNAIKYSGTSRRVEVTVALDAAAGTVSLAVRDHGIGIPADELPHLFQRFFRASTAKGIPGTGIGLALVHELVQRQDGRIAVESEPGRGSCFTVTLPLLRDAPEDRMPAG